VGVGSHLPSATLREVATTEEPTSASDVAKDQATVARLARVVGN
jgi:hypothetical protein